MAGGFDIWSGDNRRNDGVAGKSQAGKRGYGLGIHPADGNYGDIDAVNDLAQLIDGQYASFGLGGRGGNGTDA